MSQTKRNMLKIIMIGQQAVGKTSIALRYTANTFSNAYKATVGADFFSKETVINGSPVSITIWDTAGQERFQSLGPAFYRGSHGCAIVFDVTNNESFEKLEDWVNSYIQGANVADDEKIPMMLLGNKVDEENHKVTEEKVERWMQMKSNFNISYHQTSAKSAYNVNEAMDSLVERALEYYREHLATDVDDDHVRQVNFDSDPNRMTTSCSC